MAALTFKVGGDTTGLAKAMDKSKAMFGKLGAAAKKMALGAAFTGAATGMAALYASARGLKSAIDLGGSLSDLSAQTGIAVRELVILQQAFRDNGLAAEKVGPTINKMQKSISDAGNGLKTPQRALEAMGLTLEDLQNKTPLEQFQLLQKGLASIEDVTLRTGAAMDIFGRSGGELSALFQDTGAIGKAAETVGGQADILEKNAQTFDRASDLLASVGTKLEGFFVGIAAFVTPTLLPLMEKFNQQDWSSIGQQVGASLSGIIQTFSEGTFGTLVSESLILAGKNMLNFLLNGFIGLGAALGEAVKSISLGLVSWVDILGDGNFWSSLADRFNQVGMIFANTIRSALPEMLGGFSEQEQKVAEATAALVGQDADAKMEKAMQNTLPVFEGLGAKMLEAWANGVQEYGDVLDTSGNREKINDILSAANEAVEAIKDAQEEKNEDDKGGDGPGDKDQGEVFSFAKATIKPLVSSLARVGGAGISGLGAFTLDHERNRVLKMIEANTRGRQTAAVAVYQ